MREWDFCETFSEEMIAQPMAAEKAAKVSLPHTCKETPFHYFDEKIYQMVSCYQRMIVPEESWRDKVVLLTFEAVGHKADVYLNGVHLCTHENGYTAFTVDISQELHYGQENLLTVRVDSNENLNQPPFGFVIDYMTYGGIYRDVYLDIKNPMYLQDVFLKPSFQQSISTQGMTGEEIAKVLVTGVLSTEITYSPAAQEALSAGKLGVRQYIDGLPIMESP